MVGDAVMQTGDILFFKGDTLISKFISKVTRLPYTHVAIALSGSLILEADRFVNVRIRELEDDEIFIVKRCNSLSDIDKKIMAHHGVFKLSGTIKYDYFHVFHWLVRILLGKDSSFVSGMNRVYCTEVIDYLYLLVGIDLVPDRPTGDLLPEHLLNSPLLEDVYVTRGRV
jgi:hypothetical protein